MTHGRRNGAGGHGCSVVTPLVVYVDPADLGPSVCTIEGCGRPPRIHFVDRRTSALQLICCLHCCYDVRNVDGDKVHTSGCDALQPSPSNGGGHGGAIGSPLAPSSAAKTSPTPVFASAVSGMRDGSGASSTTQGRRTGAGDHGGSVVAPLVDSPSGGEHGESLSAPLATCGDAAPSPAASTSPTPKLVRKIRPMYGVLNADGSRPTKHEDGSTLTYWEMRNQFSVVAHWDDGTTMTCAELGKQIAELVQPTPYEERTVDVTYESDLWRSIRAQGYMCYRHT